MNQNRSPLITNLFNILALIYGINSELSFVLRIF